MLPNPAPVGRTDTLQCIILTDVNSQNVVSWYPIQIFILQHERVLQPCAQRVHRNTLTDIYILIVENKFLLQHPTCKNKSRDLIRNLFLPHRYFSKKSYSSKLSFSGGENLLSGQCFGQNFLGRKPPSFKILLSHLLALCNLHYFSAVNS